MSSKVSLDNHGIGVREHSRAERSQDFQTTKVTCGGGAPSRFAIKKTGRSSFLGLPVELRLLIYEYFIPNEGVWGYRLPRNLRSDKEPCCPAILRVNRQIYDEIIGMWYGTAEYGIVIMRDFHIHGRPISNPDTALSSTFRFITSLSLSVALQWFTEGDFSTLR